jgi:1-deoxy-D-xylulose-5-phosphate reductoisomerase
LNAANEVAVEAFLQRRLSFLEIPEVIERVLARHRTTPASSLDDVLSADDWARREAQAALTAAAGVCA